MMPSAHAAAWFLRADPTKLVKHASKSVLEMLKC
jgi:hypothetical protein